ncbi:MAG TPA: hypothetical protein DIC56_13635 [Rhizobium sp.]|nr:hypothetical protein [Rhizobium sp.]
MQTIFSLPAIALLLLFSILGFAGYVASVGVLAFFRRRAARLKDTIPVATFMGTVTTAWALALGFAAADVWTVRSQAEHTASAERSSISRLMGMAGPDALNLGALMDGLVNYRVAVQEREWGTSANKQPADDVDQALQSIRLAIIGMTETVPAPLIASMTQDFDELQDARNMRLAIGSSSVNEYKWYLVFFLTFLSLVAIASVHADRPLAGRSALAIFSVAAAVSLWILALHANPYAGATPLQFNAVYFVTSSQ